MSDCTDRWIINCNGGGDGVRGGNGVVDISNITCGDDITSITSVSDGAGKGGYGSHHCASRGGRTCREPTGSTHVPGELVSSSTWSSGSSSSGNNGGEGDGRTKGSPTALGKNNGWSDLGDGDASWSRWSKS